MKPLTIFLPAPVRRTLVVVPLLLCSASSWAHVTIGVHIGVPGAVYVMPPPAYVAPSAWVMPRAVLPAAVYVAPVFPYHHVAPYRLPVSSPVKAFGSRSRHGIGHPGRHARRHHGTVHGGYGGQRHR